MKTEEVKAINPDQLVQMYIDKGLLAKAQEYARLRSLNPKLSRVEIDRLLETRIRDNMWHHETEEIIRTYGTSQKVIDSLVRATIRAKSYSLLLRQVYLGASSKVAEEVIEIFINLGDVTCAEIAKRRTNPGLTLNEREKLIKAILDSNDSVFFDPNSELVKQGISPNLLEILIKKNIGWGLQLHGIDWIKSIVAPLAKYRNTPGITIKEYDSFVEHNLGAGEHRLFYAILIAEEYTISLAMVEKLITECVENLHLELAIRASKLRKKTGLKMSEVRKLIKIID